MERTLIYVTYTTNNNFKSELLSKTDICDGHTFNMLEGILKHR